MIYVFFGDDSFSKKKALDTLRAAVGPPEVRDANTTLLPSQGLTPPQLHAACQSIPFLAQRRLVIVEGVLGLAEDRGLRRRGKEGNEKEHAPHLWAEALGLLKDLPPTTDLVFLEENLSPGNPLLQRVSSIAQVRQFTSPSGEALRQWIIQRAAKKGVKVAPGALRLLVDLVGSDLWAQENELEKLSLYCTGEVITEGDVKALASTFREASIFPAVDAALEGNAATATSLLHRLLDSGAGAAYIITMLARQVRLLLLAQELRAQGLGPEEIGHRLGIRSAFPLRKTLQQAQRFPQRRLEALHERLLEADVAIKTGALGETLALEALLTELRTVS